MAALELWRGSADGHAVVGESIDTLGGDDPWAAIPGRHLLLRTPITRGRWQMMVDGELVEVEDVELVGPHEWDPTGSVAAATGQAMMQRPRFWPPMEPRAYFEARIAATADALGDELVEVDG